MNNNHKNMERRVAVDLDGVLFDFLNPFCIFYNQRHGTNFTINDLTTYHFLKIFQKPEKEFRTDMNDFYQSPLFRDLPLIRGAKRGIRHLSQNNLLVVVTSRPDHTSPVTLNSLRKHFPNIFSEVHFTSQYGGNGRHEKKSDYCANHRYSVIIEDVAEYANECAEKEIKAFLLTRPWNEKEPLHENVIRVGDWPELITRMN